MAGNIVAIVQTLQRALSDAADDGGTDPPSASRKSTPAASRSTKKQASVLIEAARTLRTLAEPVRAVATTRSTTTRGPPPRHRAASARAWSTADIKKYRDAVVAPPLMRAFRAALVSARGAIRGLALRVLRYLFILLRASKEQKVVELAWKRMTEAMVATNIHVLVAVSFERTPPTPPDAGAATPADSTVNFERTQSLLLMRTLAMCHPTSLPREFVVSLVAVAETSKDDFCVAALDLLRHVALQTPVLFVSCGGVYTMIEALLNVRFSSMAPSLVLTLAAMLDADEATGPIQTAVVNGMLKLLAVFSDFGSPDGPDKEARRSCAHTALAVALRTWAGLAALARHPQGLRSLVALLELQADVPGASWVREATFDLLFDLLRTVPARHLALSLDRGRQAAKAPSSLNLVHGYVAVLLVSLMECGLVQSLSIVATGRDADFAQVAVTMLDEVMLLTSTLLPQKIASDMHLLPSMVAMATSFAGKEDDDAVWSRVRATRVLNTLAQKSDEGSRAHGGGGAGDGAAGSGILDADDKRTTQHSSGSRLVVHGVDLRKVAHESDISRNFDRYADTMAHDGVPLPNVARGGTHGAVGRGETDVHADEAAQQRHVLSFIAHETSVHHDEQQLLTQLRATNVTQVKDYKLWNWSMCLNLLERELVHPAALSVALRTKFFKRLLSFLKPEKRQFASLHWTVNNQIFTRVSCQMFRLLLCHPEGRQYSFFIELCDQLFAALFIEIGVRDKPEPGIWLDLEVMKRNKTAGVMGNTAKTILSLKGYRPLGREHVARKMAREYFTLFGVMSSHAHGLAMFKKNKLFDNLYTLVGAKGHDYLMCLVLSNLDYRSNKNARTLLGRFGANGSSLVRRAVTAHLRLAFRARVNGFWSWGVSALVKQVVHPSPDVYMDALHVLECVCEDVTCLGMLIKKNPSLDHLPVGVAHRLRMMMLQVPAGVELLHKSGWIAQELREWGNGFGSAYADGVHSLLVSSLVGSGALLPPVMDPGEDKPDAAVAMDRAHARLDNFSARASVRTVSDDNYFDIFHRLPWGIHVIASADGGSSTRYNTLALVHADRTSNAVYHGEGPMSASDSGVSDYSGDTATWVEGVLVRRDTGEMSPLPVTPGLVLHARLSVGAGQKGKDAELKHHSTFVPARTFRVVSEADSEKIFTAPAWLFPGGEDEDEEESVSAAAMRRGHAPRGMQGSIVLYEDRCRWTLVQTSSSPLQYAVRSVGFLLPTPGTQVVAAIPASHLYGQLARTSQGISLLRGDASFNALVSGSLDALSTRDRRAALWAMASVAAAGDEGFALLFGKHTALLDYVVHGALHAPTLSLCATCFFVVGAISRSEAGQRALFARGWEAASRPHVGVAMHDGVGKLMAHRATTARSSRTTVSSVSASPRAGRAPRPQVAPLEWARDASNQFGVRELPDLKEKGGNVSKERRVVVVDRYKELSDPATVSWMILGHISNLCNGVSQKSSLTTLRELKKTHASVFRVGALYFEALKCLATFKYGLSARRFVLFDLFDAVRFDAKALQCWDGGLHEATDVKSVAKHVERGMPTWSKSGAVPAAWKNV